MAAAHPRHGKLPLPAMRTLLGLPDRGRTHLGVGAVIPAFALSRLLATAPIAPGTGVSEGGTAALLIALSAQPASTAAALLLFAFFSYAMEIPVGGLAWLTWAAAKRWRTAPPAARADTSPGPHTRDRFSPGAASIADRPPPRIRRERLVS